MGRAVSPPISDFFASAHRGFGAELLLGVGVSEIVGSSGRVRAVRLIDGSVLPADLVLLGIGVVAEDRLARDCGLLCKDGIVVDAQMLASDLGGDVRLESVQNATDQARVVAKRLTGHAANYSSLPWFWSDQGDLKLQIVGLLGDADRFALRGNIASREFSVFGFSGDCLRCVESVNRAGDHMAARRIIGENIPLSPAQASDLVFDLKAHAMRRKPIANVA
jgi:3-phenylpropionate/trans-cinnamate dioxygenase ferredoxin reductase component